MSWDGELKYETSEHECAFFFVFSNTYFSLLKTWNLTFQICLLAAIAYFDAIFFRILLIL